MICEQLDTNHSLKEAIMMRLEQEDRDNTLMLEYQMRGERETEIGHHGMERGKSQ